MKVLRKRENFCREKRVAHRNKQAFHDGTQFTAFNQWVWIFSRAYRKYRCLYEKSCAGYKNKFFAEYVWAAVDKEIGFEKGRTFLISYVAQNSNEELARYLWNGLVLPESPTNRSKPLKVFVTVVRKLEDTNESLWCSIWPMLWDPLKPYPVFSLFL